MGLVRKEFMNTITCPNCGVQSPEGAAFCDNCGSPLPSGTCPNCHAIVHAGDNYCDSCGHLLRAPGAAGAPLVVSYDDIEPDAGRRPVVIPRLLVLPAGNVLSLVPGQDHYVIGRVDPASGSYPDVDLVPFGGEEGGVSRRHARIIRADDRFLIEDLNSVNHTFLNKEKLPAEEAQPLQDGDEIRLGRVLLRFKVD